MSTLTNSWTKMYGNDLQSGLSATLLSGKVLNFTEKMYTFDADGFVTYLGFENHALMVNVATDLDESMLLQLIPKQYLKGAAPAPKPEPPNDSK